ncbi:hypothetical protein BJY01DRAFT_228116 [Aspergillus pseudoustus]|uniref:NAD(P)-binding protein n=1 Tax=Aspergillus pseudoustus TaxID=1810923 RepID=A0ABR4IMR8_9EURO
MCRGKASMRGIIYKQLFVHAKPLPSSVSLAGATAIVTGSNGGIGFEASRQLLRLGVRHLILAVRSQSRGDTAAAKLREEYPESRRIEVAILDMADYGSINAFLQFCHRLEYVDYVILNAGLQNQTFRRCDKTGHEMAFQVNCLSTGLLALSLATIMKSKKRPNNADPPVLSVVGSDTMWLSRFQPTDQVSSYMDDP